MNINIEKTKAFYQNCEVCSCLDCKNYYDQIRLIYPNICIFLESLGIDPKKPFELIPIDDENKDIISYICQYVIYGTYEEKILAIIDGIEISINENTHPSTLINEEHFVIDFGPIPFPKKDIYYLKLVSLEKRIIVVNQVLYKIDPIDLIKFGCPKDEYMLEAREIAMRMNDINEIKLEQVVFEVFKYYFNEEISKTICSKIVNEIYIEIYSMVKH